MKKAPNCQDISNVSQLQIYICLVHIGQWVCKSVPYKGLTNIVLKVTGGFERRAKTSNKLSIFKLNRLVRRWGQILTLQTVEPSGIYEWSFIINVTSVDLICTTELQILLTVPASEVARLYLQQALQSITLSGNPSPCLAALCLTSLFPVQWASIWIHEWYYTLIWIIRCSMNFQYFKPKSWIINLCATGELFFATAANMLKWCVYEWNGSQPAAEHGKSVKMNSPANFAIVQSNPSMLP